jgi:proton glutamate symport protein
VAPLLFATLVVGIAGHSNLKQVGRMGVKSLIYFEVITTLALVIGWAAITISRAGEGINLPPAEDATEIQEPVQRTWQEIVLDIFPENIARSVVDAEILQIVVFSVIFGIGLAMVPEAKRRPMLAFADSLAETMFKFTKIVMLVAPVGVGAAIAYTVGRLGLGIDELLDMVRTSLNVLGNCLATIVIARWEGEFNPDAAPQATAPAIRV